MNKFWIIASDVYKKNVKSISFLVMILVPFIMLGIVYFAGTFASQNTEVSTIGIYAEDDQVAQVFASMEDSEYSFEVVSSKESAQAQLEAEQIDAYLELEVTDTEVSGVLFSEASLGQTTELTLQQLLTSFQASARAQSLGLTKEQVASLNQPANFSKQKVSFEDGQMLRDEDQSDVQYIVSYVGTIVLFIFILTYAQIIAQEIASEKGTRIMEVILSSTKAQTHFYGKLCGVLLVALTQLVMYVVIFGVGYTWFKDFAIVQTFINSISLEKLLGPFLVVTLLYMLLGILIFAVLAALCGSLVNKAEDTAKAILPVTYLSLGGYMLGLLLGAQDPSNLIVKITSFIPFLSSYTMPVRLANGVAETGEVVISLGILLVATVVLMLLSAKMYKANVLVYNENGVFAAMKQAFTLMRNEQKNAQ
ncbi:MAG: ABC transporter permease [Enterococcus sp.]